MDYIPLLQKSFNDTKFKAILNFSPNEIIHDEKKILKLKKHYANEFRKHHLKTEKQKSYLRQGNHVRKLLPSKTFSKGYLPSFSSEIYEITREFPTSPPVFAINDNSSKKYYSEELSRTNPNATFKKDLYVDKTRKVEKKNNTIRKIV